MADRITDRIPASPPAAGRTPAPAAPPFEPAPPSWSPQVGTTLETVLARGEPVPLDRALAILSDVANELDTLVARNTAYGAVSPSSILIGPDGHAHLAAPDRVTLRTGYIAPEQRHGDPVSPSLDQYALAIVAFELLSGQRREARLADSSVDVVNEIHVGPERVLRAGVGPQVNEVIHKALARDPAWRYRSAVGFVRALSDAVHAVASKEEIDEETITRLVELREKREKDRRKELGAPKGGLLVSTAGYAVAVAMVVASAWLADLWHPGILQKIWDRHPAGVSLENPPSAGPTPSSGPSTSNGSSSSSSDAQSQAGAAGASASGTTGFIRVSVDQGEPTVFVDGRPVGVAPGVFRLAEGPHTISLRALNRTYSPASQSVGVSSGDTSSTSFSSR